MKTNRSIINTNMQKMVSTMDTMEKAVMTNLDQLRHCSSALRRILFAAQCAERKGPGLRVTIPNRSIRSGSPDASRTKEGIDDSENSSNRDRDSLRFYELLWKFYEMTRSLNSMIRSLNGFKKGVSYENRTRNGLLERSVRTPLHHQFEKSLNEKNCLVESSLLIGYGAWASIGILNGSIPEIQKDQNDHDRILDLDQHQDQIVRLNQINADISKLNQKKNPDISPENHVQNQIRN